MIALQPPRHHTRSSGDSFQRSRPAFEKLFIGPVMVFGEMITGGHYLEVLRVGKQLAVGREAAPSYVALHRNLVHESGFFGAFYRGFMPWGLFQCCKGVPVLFVQHESMHHLQATAGWSSNSAEKASGFLGGFAQALFVNPLQKIKVSVVACQNMNAMHPTQAFKTLIKQNGVLSLYDGFAPMALRRSLDWGIRFAVTSEVKNWVIALKVREGQSSELNFWELICCGMIGGALSTATHPIDNIITNSMKPMPVGVPRDFVSVTRRMYRESGIKGFTRAWGINMLDNAYHMAWMYGVGTVAYEWMGKALQSPRH